MFVACERFVSTEKFEAAILRDKIVLDVFIAVSLKNYNNVVKLFFYFD